VLLHLLVLTSPLLQCRGTTFVHDSAGDTSGTRMVKAVACKGDPTAYCGSAGRMEIYAVECAPKW